MSVERDTEAEYETTSGANAPGKPAIEVVIDERVASLDGTGRVDSGESESQLYRSAAELNTSAYEPVASALWIIDLLMDSNIHP